MTVTEKAVCELYTGYCFCTGEERRALYKYAERIMGRPVQPIELEMDSMCRELHDRARSDFVKICEGKRLGFNVGH